MSTVIKAQFRLRRDLLASRGLEKGGRVQQAIDKAVIDYSLPYCPWNTGTLAKSAYSATSPGQGQVVYPGPYARYQYYGEIYGPNIPVFEDSSGEPTRFWSPPGQKKHPTGRPLDYSKSKYNNGPLAGSHWFERMKADHLEDILKEAVAVASGK